MKKMPVNQTTNRQKQIIHVLEHQLIEKGLLDDEGYHSLLMGRFGKRSSRDLTREEASLLIEELIRMGGVTSGQPKRISPRRRLKAGGFREESSVGGLRLEVVDIARERYGKDFEKPLAALCRKLNVEDYRSMDVRHGKALKDALLRLQAEGPYRPGRK